jgi:hypothetical protein
MTLKGDGASGASKEDYLTVLKECLGIVEDKLKEVLNNWMTTLAS